MSESNEIVIGEMKIAENVLIKMVRESAAATKGVTAVRDVTVAPGESSVNVGINITVGYKTIYPEVAAEVQSAVIESIGRMTGVKVDEVNVMVDRLDFKHNAGA